MISNYFIVIFIVLQAKELSLVGGTDVKDMVKRLMYKLFKNELGVLYSWEGAKKKLKFKSLKFSGVIIGMLLSSFYFHL